MCRHAVWAASHSKKWIYRYVRPTKYVPILQHPSLQPGHLQQSLPKLPKISREKLASLPQAGEGSCASITWRFPVTRDIRAATFLSSGLDIEIFKLKLFHNANISHLSGSLARKASLVSGNSPFWAWVWFSRSVAVMVKVWLTNVLKSAKNCEWIHEQIYTLLGIL